MPFTTYAELQTEVADFMHRADISAKAEDLIKLGEAKLNRRIGIIETVSTLTGTVDQSYIDISALNAAAAHGVWNTYDAGRDEPVPLKAINNLTLTDVSQRPRLCALSENNDRLQFDCPLDKQYTFRFRYRGRIALSDSVTSNQLLVDHPDVYLAVSLVWGYAYTRNIPQLGVHKQVLDEFLSETQQYLALAKKGEASLDAALSMVGGGSSYNIYTDGQR